MAVESAEDLAGFFEDDEFGEAASYVPPGGGDAVPCTVIVDRGQGRTHFDAGERHVASAERLVQVRAAEVVPSRGGRFTLEADAEVIEVVGSPALDHTGAIYSAEVVIRG